MPRRLKILIIGDYNFTYNTHVVINHAIDHACEFLQVNCDYYWMKLRDFSGISTRDIKAYDGFWLAPSPFFDVTFLTETVAQLEEQTKPVLITGEGFEALIQDIAVKNHLCDKEEKIISENIINKRDFESVKIFPTTSQMTKLYENHSNVELTTCHYSIYPTIVEKSISSLLDIEAINEFEEPVIVSLKNRVFFVATSFCPHISSQRGHSHPLIYTFIKALDLPQK